MNSLFLNPQETITSREIAEITGKQHAHLMRDIREMEEAWVNVGQSKFGLIYYTDQLNRQQPQYVLNKKESLYIATKFNDEARARLILRWEELEKKQQHIIPQSLPEALRLAAELAEKAEYHKKQLEAAQPKIAFADAVSASSNSILVRELAKLVAQNGYDIGQDRLFDWMVANRFLIRKKIFHASKNKFVYQYEPTQYSINNGLLETLERVFGDGENGNITRFTVKVTGKGQTYFVNRIMKDYMSGGKEAI